MPAQGAVPGDGERGQSDERPQSGERPQTSEPEPETSSELELTAGSGESDDDVHFGVAAKALGVSRKTVERMVKRGQLERGPSGAQATVSKRALVAVLEQRRRDVARLTRGGEVELGDAGHGQWTTPSPQTPWPQETATTEVQELVRSVLGPLLDEFVAVRARAAVLEAQLEAIKEHAARERARDQLLVALATGGWWQRRRARRTALRRYVLADDPPPDSAG